MGIAPPTTLESAAFPGIFLRMDGNGVSSPVGPGAGTVNCQYGAGPWEKYDVANIGGGMINLQSNAFPGVFLRMDASGVTAPAAPGAGVVNCQYGAGPWERFRFEMQPDGTVAVASAQFPGVYLRMDGSGVTSPVGPGAGTVNCQFGIGPWEKFKVVGVQIMEFTGQNQLACACLTALNGAAGQASAQIIVLPGAPSLSAGLCGCDPSVPTLPPVGVDFTVTAPDGTTYSSASQSSGSVDIGILNEALVSLIVLAPVPGTWTITVNANAGTSPWRLMMQSHPTQQVIATWAAAVQAEFGGGTSPMLSLHERNLLASSSLGSAWTCLPCKIMVAGVAMAIFVAVVMTLTVESPVVLTLAGIANVEAALALEWIQAMAGYTLGEIIGSLCTYMDAC